MPSWSRRLLDGQLLDLAQHEHDAKPFRQIVDQSVKNIAHFAPPRFDLRIGGQAREEDESSLAGLVEIYGVEADGRPPFTFPAQSLVDGDAGQPCCERGLAAEVGEVGEGPQIRFLNRVLGFHVVAQDAARRPVQALIVALHDPAEGT